MSTTTSFASGVSWTGLYLLNFYRSSNYDRAGVTGGEQTHLIAKYLDILIKTDKIKNTQVTIKGNMKH